MSYATLNDALQSSKEVMQAGAQMVKMEGKVVHGSVKPLQHWHVMGIPVCVHLGLTTIGVYIWGL